MRKYLLLLFVTLYLLLGYTSILAQTLQYKENTQSFKGKENDEQDDEDKDDDSGDSGGDNSGSDNGGSGNGDDNNDDNSGSDDGKDEGGDSDNSGGNDGGSDNGDDSDNGGSGGDNSGNDDSDDNDNNSESGQDGGDNSGNDDKEDDQDQGGNDSENDGDDKGDENKDDEDKDNDDDLNEFEDDHQYYVGTVSANDGNSIIIDGSSLKGESPWLKILNPGMLLEVYGKWEDDVFIAQDIKVMMPAQFAYYQGPAEVFGKGQGTIEAWMNKQKQLEEFTHGSRNRRFDYLDCLL